MAISELYAVGLGLVGMLGLQVGFIWSEYVVMRDWLRGIQRKLNRSAS